MRKVLGVFFCIMLLFVSSAFAQDAREITLPDFANWPVKFSASGVDTIDGKQVTFTINTYYDHAQTREAKNIVVDIHIGDSHTVVWFTVIHKESDTITVFSRLYNERTVLVLISVTEESLPTENFYHFLNEIGQ